MDYTTRRRTATNPDAIVLQFLGCEQETVIVKTFRRDGYHGKKTHGYSTPITVNGRVIDHLFCRSWDGMVEAIRRGEHRRSAQDERTAPTMIVTSRDAYDVTVDLMRDESWDEWADDDEPDSDATHEDQNPYPHGTQAAYAWNMRHRRSSFGTEA